MSIRKHPKSDLLFPGDNPEKPWDFRKPLAKAVDLAKLDENQKERFVFHHLRHTFCSQLAMMGNDLATIMSLSGHKSHRMVLRYVKLNATHKLKALDGLEKKMNLKKSGSSVQSTVNFNESSGTIGGTIQKAVVVSHWGG